MTLMAAMGRIMPELLHHGGADSDGSYSSDESDGDGSARAADAGWPNGSGQRSWSERLSRVGTAVGGGPTTEGSLPAALAGGNESDINLNRS